MRITQTDIAEILFTDDEMLTFEEVVDILRMDIRYHPIDGEEMAGITIIIPSMNRKVDFRFCLVELTSTDFLNSEWMLRREVVKKLQLESWLNTPIDCSTENMRYFHPQNFGIKKYMMGIDNTTE